VSSAVFAHRVLVNGLDVAGITLAGATIHHGATGSSTVAEPATAYLELVSADAAGNLLVDYPEYTFGDAIDSGFVEEYRDKYEGGATKLVMRAPVQIVTGTPTGFTDLYVDTYDAGFDSVRFTGVITSIDVTAGLVTITAVNAVEQLARVILEHAGWPAEADTARAQRIAAAAGVTGLVVDGTATHTVAAVAADAKPATAWQLMAKLAEDADALLYADRLGVLHYRTLSATQGSTVHAAPSATLIDDLRMTQQLGDIVNTVTVTYGDPPTDVVTDDNASIAAYGVRARAVSADVVDNVGAGGIAQRILADYKEPAWRMTAATVNLMLAARSDTHHPSKVTELLDLDLDDAVTVGELLPAWPLRDYTARIVGYVETLDPIDWRISYTLDPRRRT
jgi:hypothetical protein